MASRFVTFKNMKLKISDIPIEGLDLSARTDEDRWFVETVKDVYREDYPHGNIGSVQLHFLKIRDNVMVKGEAKIDLQPHCARCLETFSRPVSVPVDMTLAPYRETKTASGGEIELAEDDLNFSFYKGDVIDVGEIVREFLVLAVPLRYLCREKCEGICPRCGQNLNEKSCRCHSAKGDPRLQVLKNFKKFLTGVLLLLPLALHAGTWQEAGVPFESPPRPRKGFFLAGGPALGGIVNEIRRPTVGAGVMAGYGITDLLLAGASVDYRVTQQFQIYFQFLDLTPKVSYFVWEDLYLSGRGGVTFAFTSGGTNVEGFSRAEKATRLGYLGGAGVGYVFLTRPNLSLVGEVEGVYRRIKTANFFEPVVRGLLIWGF